MSLAIKLIDALPAFLSPEERSILVRSTPASFNDIPPTLRHKEDSVSVKIDPPLPEFSDQNALQGSLYVLESVLVFMSTTGRGLQIEYPSISLHAISRAAEAGTASIYCQLDEKNAAGPLEDAGGGHDDDDEDATGLRELCIFPTNESALEPIFEALSICASLHPDATVTEEDDDLDDAFISTGENGIPIFTGSEDEELSEAGRAALAHLESVICDHSETSTTGTP